MIVGRRCTWIMADGQGLVCCGHHLDCMRKGIITGSCGPATLLLSRYVYKVSKWIGDLAGDGIGNVL